MNDNVYVWLCGYGLALNISGFVWIIISPSSNSVILEDSQNLTKTLGVVLWLQSV